MKVIYEDENEGVNGYESIRYHTAGIFGGYGGWSSGDGFGGESDGC
jgi:hypothetical protein